MAELLRLVVNAVLYTTSALRAASAHEGKPFAATLGSESGSESAQLRAGRSADCLAIAAIVSSWCSL